MAISNIDQLAEERFKLLLADARYQQKDPFGLYPQRFIQAIRLFLPLYKDYFRVRVYQSENIPSYPVMTVSNHSGQLPFDGVMLIISHLLHSPRPIIMRSMAERFLMSLPFLGKLAAETGAILGDRKNCRFVLERKESVLIFPEGVRGISKSTHEFYQLKNFSLGFIRLALTYQVPILPVAIIGAEENYPYVIQLPFLARLFNVPAIPLTPFFPLLGPLGMIPMPSPIDIYYGKPITLPTHIPADAPEHIMRPLAQTIQDQIQEMIIIGRKNQRPMFDDELKNNVKEYYQKLKERWILIKNFLQK